jgi:hypothetical protein
MLITSSERLVLTHLEQLDLFMSCYTTWVALMIHYILRMHARARAEVQPYRVTPPKGEARNILYY